MNNKIVALTGAGISRPSGLPTYTERPELRELFSSILKFDWYKYIKLYEEMAAANPNKAHYSLAKAGIPVITQNIDRLHEMAGSEKVLHLHGCFDRSVCMDCGWKSLGWDSPREDFNIKLLYLRSGIKFFKCPHCGAWLRPDIVFYGEDLKDWWKAVDWVAEAKTVLVIGTSLKVRPFNVLPEMAWRNGAEVIKINERAEVEVPKILERMGF